jgi:hypothetical protein
VDWVEVRSSIADSAWGWIVTGLLVAQLPRLTQALTTLGSVPVSLPFGPVYTMQLAMGYMNVALPSNLARMAVNIRFFQRQGLSAPIAVASGAIDSFVGTVVQAVLLGILLSLGVDARSTCRLHWCSNDLDSRGDRHRIGGRPRRGFSHPS